jgi:DNA-binding response OmpR family regulator
MRLLIVDDDPNIRTMFKEYFSAHGFGVAEAGDGTEGVTRAAQVRPHVIIMDVMMPSAYGTAALKSIREIRELENTPVIVHSGANPEAVEKLVPREDPHVRIFPKPADLPSLLNLAKELGEASGVV